MRRRKAELLGDLVHQMLREDGIETPYNEYRLVAAWPEVMGQGVNNYTGEIYIRNRTLFVRLKSPALKMNLMYGRQSLVNRLNEHVGAQVIEQIVFI